MRKPVRKLSVFGGLAGLLLSTLYLGTAEASHVGCGTVITADTTLDSDIGPCSGNGIIIGADNITLNLNGHEVLGNSDEGAAGEFAGIRLPFRTGVTVIGSRGRVATGRVTGFEAGVVVNGGSGNTIGNLVIQDNVGPKGFEVLGGTPFAELGDGIAIFNSARNRVTNNVIARNGHYDGIAVLGIGSDSNVIQRNLIEDSVGIAENRTLSGVGVIVNTFLDLEDIQRGESVYDNRVIGNTIRRNNGSGVSNISNVNGRVVGNHIEDNGSPYYKSFDAYLQEYPAHGIGIRAGQEARQNTQMYVADNTVVHNGLDGIIVQSDENRVQSNEVIDNGIFGIELFTAERNLIAENATSGNIYWDLLDQSGYEDGNYDCDENRWIGNTWGPVTPELAAFGIDYMYFPDCTATGGSGPNPPSSAADASAAAAAATAAESPLSPFLESDEGAPVPMRGRPAGN